MATATKTRRNDPCPCGSGKKYKQCCLHHGGTASPPAPGADVIQLAMDWLDERHGSEFDRAFAEVVFAGLDGDEAAAMFQLPDAIVSVVDANGREVALAERDLRLDDGEVTTFVDLVLGPDGPPLDAAQREYLAAVGRRSMSFYEVVEHLPGEGAELRDLLDEDEPVRTVASPVLSQTLAGAPGQVFGARLVPGTPWTVSGESIFPSQKSHVERLMGQICEEEEKNGADEVGLRRLRSMLIVYGWVLILTRTSPESFTAAAAGLREPS